MNYEGEIYRPPSEASSLLIQVSIGCSHNKCTFCSMYKDKQFRIKDLESVKKEILSFIHKERVKRVFLCDGDALALPTEQLLEILILIKENFINCTRVSSYATFQDLERKSADDLLSLYNHGLTLLYLGAESGSDEVLKRVNKGVTSKVMIESSNKAKKANMKLSVMIISGLGGQELFNEHALESAKLLNAINPNYFGLLSLMVQDGTLLSNEVISGSFKLTTPSQIVEEMRIIIKNLDLTNCIFSTSHISNYLHLKGQLPNEKNRLLDEIDYYIENPTSLRTGYRGL